MKKRLLGFVLAVGSILMSAVIAHADTGDSVQAAAEVKVGDIITFGKYEQDNDVSNGKEDIEWIVLDQEDDKVLLLSKYNLDENLFNQVIVDSHKIYYDNRWETSLVRKWLNGPFFDTAFEKEKDAVQITHLHSEKSPAYGTADGNDTDDRVFCLSIDEVEKYLESDDLRGGFPTEYLWSQVISVNENTGMSSWWLRSPGLDTEVDAVAYVTSKGELSTKGLIPSIHMSLRPAMWVKLETGSEPAEPPVYEVDTGKTDGDLQAGDIVTFGSYEQDNDISNGKEDIEWIVLDTEDNKAFLISKYVLDAIPYYEELDEVTWETSTLRSWLNGPFIESAFEEEKDAVLTTFVLNEDNQKYETEGGNDTYDKVFCLSETELHTYYTGLGYATEYAIRKNVTTNEETGASWWWLRSPGSMTVSADFANHFGAVHCGGAGVSHDLIGVRPALWVNLEALLPVSGVRNEIKANDLSSYDDAALEDAYLIYRGDYPYLDILKNDSSISYRSFAKYYEEHGFMDFSANTSASFTDSTVTIKDYTDMLAEIMTFNEYRIVEQIEQLEDYNDIKEIDDRIYDGIGIVFDNIDYARDVENNDILEGAGRTAYTIVNYAHQFLDAEIEAEDIDESNFKYFLTIIGTYSGNDQFLTAVYENTDNKKLKKAASRIMEANKSLSSARISLVRDKNWDNTKYSVSLVYEAILEPAFSYVTNNASDEETFAVMKKLRKAVKYLPVSEISLTEKVFESIMYVGDYTAGTSDTHDYFQKIKAMNDIAKAVIIELDSINVDEFDDIKIKCDAIIERCFWYRYLLTINSRGESYLYTMLTSDNTLLNYVQEWKKGLMGERAVEDWYSADNDFLVRCESYIQTIFDEIRDAYSTENSTETSTGYSTQYSLEDFFGMYLAQGGGFSLESNPKYSSGVRYATFLADSSDPKNTIRSINDTWAITDYEIDGNTLTLNTVNGTVICTLEEGGEGITKKVNDREPVYHTRYERE